MNRDWPKFCGICRLKFWPGQGAAMGYAEANGRTICAGCLDEKRRAGKCWRCGGQLYDLKEHDRAQCRGCLAEVVP
jgi:hypothetical protein